MEAKEKEYFEAKDALAIVNRIESLAWQTRYARQKYKVENKDEHLDTIAKNCQTLDGYYDQLEKMHPTAEEKNQIADARKYTRSYAETAKKWADEKKRDEKSSEVASFDKQNAEAGNAVGKAAATYLAAKESSVNKIAQSIFIVAKINSTALTTRLNANKYMIAQNQEDWVATQEGCKTLQKLYDELRKVSLTEEDQKRIERADKATKEYLAAATQWYENDKNLTTVILPEMKKGGETVLATAQTAENDAWKASDEASNSVLAVVSTSKFIIIVTLIVGIVVALALGFLISKSISKMLAVLIGETKRLCEATVEGKLQTRGNPESGFPRIPADHRREPTHLIDAFVAPINVTAEYVDRISKGDIPPKITDTYNGDFNEIKNNLNQCIDVMNGLLQETNTLIQATQDGKLQTRGNAQQFAGGWGELVGGVNKLIDAFVAPINVTAEYVDRISKGDIPPKITDNYNGDFNEIKNNLNQCIDADQRLDRRSARRLSQAAADGKLGRPRRRQPSIQGEYREIIHGMNKTLEGFATPMHDIGETLKRLANKDFSQAVETEYPGAYGELRDNVNLGGRRASAAPSSRSPRARTSSPKARGSSPRVRRRWPPARRRKAPSVEEMIGAHRRAGPLGRCRQGKRHAGQRRSPTRPTNWPKKAARRCRSRSSRWS